MNGIVHPPKQLQALLWSANVLHVDIQKDKGYIIHQILSHGTLVHIRWLLDTYKKTDIRDIFQQFPYKDYRLSRFHFVKNMLLNLDTQLMDERRYVKNIPRAIG